MHVPPILNSTAEPPLSAPARSSAGQKLTVFAAGTAFAAAATLPGAIAAEASAVTRAGLLTPLLLVGLLVPRSGVSSIGLLVLYPLLVALSLATSGGRSPSALASAMIAVTWFSYAGLALRLTRPPPGWDVSHHPIVDAQAKEPRRRRLVRAAYWTVLLAGCVWLAIVAPLLGPDSVYQAAWGDAAPAARLLVAIVGGAVAVGAVAAIVGPGLRQRTPGASQTVARTRRRALLYLAAAAAFAAVAWAISLRGVP
jgi:hypothetical protein